jgi:hypothetical protein
VRDERVEHFGGGAPGAAHAFEGFRPMELDRPAAADDLGPADRLILSHRMDIGLEPASDKSVRRSLSFDTPFRQAQRLLRMSGLA